jgi:hypothetical protein
MTAAGKEDVGTDALQDQVGQVEKNAGLARAQCLIGPDVLLRNRSGF